MLADQLPPFNAVLALFMDLAAEIIPEQGWLGIMHGPIHRSATPSTPPRGLVCSTLKAAEIVTGPFIVVRQKYRDSGSRTHTGQLQRRRGDSESAFLR